MTSDASNSDDHSRQIDAAIAEYLEALEQGTPLDREAFLAQHPEIAGELRQFLEDDSALKRDAPRPVTGRAATSDQSHDSASPIAVALSEPARTSDLASAVAPGTTIGTRYRLLEVIGEGGMGTVWMAEQREPMRRMVALKLIKPGMSSKAVLTRFGAERQALALMDHPNIAKVLDGGTTEDGRPYFVMELVRGIPLTQYCDDRRLPVSARLDLFVQVCQAVQHAHQKGIIHRDIKPTNILVTEHDGRPVPKVIDFGLAKALQGPQALTEHTMFTAFGAMVGTPLYMAPEQVGINAVDVDTRSDVYALGVILYELLTGSTPLEKRRFKEAAWDEICRLIREEEPPRPSLRLSSSDALPSIAACRHTEPEKLGKLVRGDLDWIVLKALEKDRNRRYETANGLAVDIQRHLDNDPVLARPPTSLYRFQKMVRRNKLAFVAGSAVIAALVVGLGLSTWLFLQEKAARQRAVAAEAEQGRLREQAETARATEAELRQNEAKLRQQAEADEKKAQTEAAKSAQVAAFMKDMLKGVGPMVALGRDTKMLREILDQTAKRLDVLHEQPAVEADLRTSLGDVYTDLGEFTSAETMHRQALEIREKLLGDEHPDVATSLHNLANVLSWQGKLAESEMMLRKVLAMRKKLLGDEHPDVAISLDLLADVLQQQGEIAKAEPLAREAVAMHKKLLGNEHPDAALLMSLNNLAFILRRQGKLAEAETLFRETLAMKKQLLGNEHPYVANSLGHLANILVTQGKLAEAEAMQREALAMRKKLLGNEHPDVATSLNDLALVLNRQGKPAEAAAMQRDAVAMRKKLLGNEHPFVASSLISLANMLRQQDKLAEAEAMYREALAIRRKLSGEEHPYVATSLNDLAWVLSQQDKLAEAEAMYREAVAMRKKLLGDEHLDVATSLNGLAWVLNRQSKLAEAEAMYREALTMRKKLLGDEHLDVATSLNGLAWVLNRQSKLAEAEAMYREALTMRKKLLGDAHPDVATSFNALAWVLNRQDKLAEAETMYREAVTIRKKLPGADPEPLIASLNGLTSVLIHEGKTSDAEALFTELLPPGALEDMQNLPVVRARGNYFGRVGRWREAAADYARCVDGARDNVLFLSPKKLVCLELAQWDKVFDEVVKLRPQETSLWIGRGQYHSLRSRFAEAAADYATVTHDRQIGDDTADYAFLLALLGDEKGYQQFCKELAARNDKPSSEFRAFILAWCCSIGQNSGVDPVRVVGWAEQGVAGDHSAWRVNAVGLAQYRAGQFDRAIQSLQESNRLVWGLAVPQEYAVNWFVMAMAHHRLGQSDAARQCLETGRKLMDLGRPKTPDEPAKFTAPADWIMANVLLREAERFCNLLPQAPDRAREIILRALSLAILLGLAGSRWPGMHRDDERRLVSSISLTFRIVVESELKKVILILAYRSV